MKSFILSILVFLGFPHSGENCYGKKIHDDNHSFTRLTIYLEVAIFTGNRNLKLKPLSSDR